MAVTKRTPGNPRMRHWNGCVQQGFGGQSICSHLFLKYELRTGEFTRATQARDHEPGETD